MFALLDGGKEEGESFGGPFHLGLYTFSIFLKCKQTTLRLSPTADLGLASAVLSQLLCSSPGVGGRTVSSDTNEKARHGTHPSQKTRTIRYLTTMTELRTDVFVPPHSIGRGSGTVRCIELRSLPIWVNQSNCDRTTSSQSRCSRSLAG